MPAVVACAPWSCCISLVRAACRARSRSSQQHLHGTLGFVPGVLGVLTGVLTGVLRGTRRVLWGTHRVLTGVLWGTHRGTLWYSQGYSRGYSGVLNGGTRPACWTRRAARRRRRRCSASPCRRAGGAPASAPSSRASAPATVLAWYSKYSQEAHSTHGVLAGYQHAPAQTGGPAASERNVGQSRRRCGRVCPPVPAQMWAGVSPSPGADVGGGEPMSRRRCGGACTAGTSSIRTSAARAVGRSRARAHGAGDELAQQLGVREAVEQVAAAARQRLERLLHGQKDMYKYIYLYTYVYISIYIYR
jgi:hypothetical protein